MDADTRIRIRVKRDGKVTTIPARIGHLDVPTLAYEVEVRTYRRRELLREERALRRHLAEAHGIELDGNGCLDGGGMDDGLST